MTDALKPAGFVHAGPAGGLLVFFYCYLFFLVVRKPFEWMASHCCKGALIEELETDDVIDKYQNTLDEDDKTWSLMEEQLMNDYGI